MKPYARDIFKASVLLSCVMCLIAAIIVCVIAIFGLIFGVAGYLHWLKVIAAAIATIFACRYGINWIVEDPPWPKT